jgi:hypothetical protein
VPNLGDAIGRLYDAFSAVAKPHSIDPCPHCLDRNEVGALLGKPLREVTPEELSPYASSALLTVGEAADYLYFLPRILEVTATEPSWWPDPEVTGRAIRATSPETWTAAQRAALNDFLEAVVGTVIQSGEYDRLDEVDLCHREDGTRRPSLLGSGGEIPCGGPGVLRAERRRSAAEEAHQRLLGTPVPGARRGRRVVLLARDRQDPVRSLRLCLESGRVKREVTGRRVSGARRCCASDS